MPIKYPSHIDEADHIAVLDKLADASNQGLLSNCYAHLGLHWRSQFIAFVPRRLHRHCHLTAEVQKHSCGNM